MIIRDPDASERPSILSELSEHQQQQLTELLDRYLCGLERGERQDIEMIKQEHPDLADALTTYFLKLDLLHGIAAGFHGSDDDELRSLMALIMLVLLERSRG